jgi:hypothetical protein
MSGRNLEYLLRPRSVAVIGASHCSQRIGAAGIGNLHNCGFTGSLPNLGSSLMPVRRVTAAEGR